MAEGDVEYTKPTALLDLERRQEEERAKEAGEEVPSVGEPRNWQVEGNETEAFIGVDPEYQNYADETGQPFKTEEGAEQVVEEKVVEFLAAEKENVTTENGEQATTEEPAPEPEQETRSTRRSREPAPE